MRIDLSYADLAGDIVQDDIRLTDPTRHKFNSAMAEYLYMYLINGDDGEARVTFGEGEWANLYGKWILAGDNCGFVNAYKHSSKAEADSAWQDYVDAEQEYNAEDEWDDDADKFDYVEDYSDYDVSDPYDKEYDVP
jgi:hypothetical protein